MIDGGPGADPAGKLDAWLVTDERAELISGIRRLAFTRQLVPRAATFRRGNLRIERRPVIHTSHPTWGYLIVWGNKRVAWAPEFFRFPGWATGADLMFAEAAAWSRPIRFRGGVGGHLDTLAVARSATTRGVRRLVFVHIGRPTIRAIDRGCRAPFGEFARDGQIFIIRRTDPS
jgi:Beta-lactamase superfamily domain